MGRKQNQSQGHCTRGQGHKQATTYHHIKFEAVIVTELWPWQNLQTQGHCAKVKVKSTLYYDVEHQYSITSQIFILR